MVILNNGSAIDMRAWIGDVGAVVEAWLPGQAGAAAVVDVLYGDVNPSGKLGETFPMQLSDTPCYLSFPGTRNEVRYGEEIYVGYRAYEAQERPVLFPFGFGLSYTQFAYDNLRVSASSLKAGEGLEVSVDVTNTGDVAGKEIVQVYVRDVEARLQRPPKELKAFAKVTLEPGETKTVTLQLDERAFAYYDPAYHQWVVEAGEFEILVGASSADIRRQRTVAVTQGTPLPSIINANSTVAEWMADPRGAALIQPMLDQMTGAQDADALGADMSEFFKDLPLTTLLGFQGAELQAPPEQIVQGMLQQLAANE